MFGKNNSVLMSAVFNLDIRLPLELFRESSHIIV